MNAASLKAVFGLDATGLRTELRTLGRDIRKTANQWGKLITAGATAAFVALSRDAINLGASLDATAKKLGLTTDLIQELGYAGDQFGIRQETTNMALQRFARRLGEAQNGSGELLPTIQQYGIALTDVNGRQRTTTEVLGDYAELLKSTANPQERLRLAFKAFDSEGAALVTVLKDGKQGLKEWGDQARESGAVLSRETIASLAQAENAISNFKTRATVAIGNIIVNFRTAEGIKLMELQLGRAAASFSYKIFDAITYPLRAGQEVMVAVLINVGNRFRNIMLDAIEVAATAANMILPSKWIIDTSAIAALKTEVNSIGDAISRAIANTDLTPITDAITTPYDELIAKQQQIVDNLNRVDFAEPAANLNTALKTGGEQAAEAISASAQDLAEAGEATATRIGHLFDALNGETISRLESGTISELIRQTSQKLSALLNPALNSNFDTFGTRLTAASLQVQLANAQAELNTRTNFARAISGPGGVDAARRNYDPLQFERLLQQFGPGSQDLQKQTVNELKTLNDRIRGGLDVRDIS